MAEFSNFDIDLEGLANFSFNPSSLSYLMQDTTAAPSPLDIRKAEIAAEVAAKAAQQPVQPVRETADLSGYYNALRQGTKVSDIDTVGQTYDQALAETLANQGIVDTTYAEGGGAYGAGVGNKPTVSAFTAPDYEPRELGKFQGNLSAHTSSSLDQIKEFQARLEPLMAPEMARLQTQQKLDYKDAVEQAYIQNPEIQALYNEYDVKPFRATKDGSIYLYDPFTFGEIRTLEVKDRDLQNALKAVTQIGVSILTGGAGAAMGLTGAAAAATSAAVSGFTTAAQGGDTDAILNSVLMAGGTTLLKGAVDKVKEGVENVAEETLQTISPELKASIPEIVPTNVSEAAVVNPSSVIDLAGDPSAFAGLDIAGLTPEAAQTVSDIQYRVVDAIGADSFEKMDSAALRRELVRRGDTEGLAAFGLTERTEGFFPSFTDLRQDVLQEYITSTGPAFAPDVIGGRTTDSLLIDRPPVVREYKIEDLLTEPERTTPVRPQPPAQTPGGGGGAPSAAASAPTATTVTAPTAPSATITPTVLPPMLTAPGSVTNALLTNTLSALASASAVSTPSQQPTVAPPVTPVATTAPTPEPTLPTTTEPTDILEDTTAEDTTAQIEAEQQAQAEAQEAQAAREAEAARLAEEARKAAEARAAAEAKAAAEQEAIAQAEARAEAAEARLTEQQAQAQADAAAAEARYGEAVAAGEALGEAQYGEGLGTGRGQGAGAGIGAGLGLGLLSGMLGGQGGTGGYKPPDFEDYQFRKTYQAPELLELAPQYEGYQAPAAYDSTNNYAQSVADQIRNLTSFPALSKDQVQNSLGLFQDSLLQEAVMQNLYGAGGR